jgi:uncharacterized protein DUF5916/cellulose/xylan binding protein with CBM9 domain
VQAVRLHQELTIDGRLDEDAWQRATPATQFTQTQPLEGPPATQRTEVRFLFDDDALYIGARMYDSLGRKGVRTRLARRDDQIDLDNGPSSQITSDKLTITLDPYHDHLTRAAFEINPSGVIGDALGAGGSNLDASWDPVWQAATQIDSLGWTAEIRIPFSQLRYSRDTNQTWGLEIVRVIDRLNERDAWAFFRKNEAGGASRYGHLTGIVVHHHARQFEVLPYVLAQEEATGLNRGNPLLPVNKQTFRGGGDVKYLLTSNLTLDATLNPDFGQVDLDPAVINLTAFETFYPEKRPFFVSGSGAFDYGGFNCYFCSNASSLSLFYSRRIGRTPQLAGNIINAATTQYYDSPTNTQILGAAKVTGRTHDGYTVGLLDALTNSEDGSFVGTPALGGLPGNPNQRWTTTVEPRTNYFVGRLKKDFRDGATVVGGMVTSTVRSLGTGMVRDSLHSHAEAGGIDFLHTWAARNYSLMGNLAVSDVAGSASAIQRTEFSSAHYFQRPDRRDVTGGLFSNRVDGATSLRGWASYLRLAKDNGDWLWEVQSSMRSPGFEVNDLAFQQHADYQWFNANVARQWTVPHGWYRFIWVSLGAQRQYNFDGDLTSQQIHTDIFMDLPNYWHVETFFIHRPTSLDDQVARGGPVFRRFGINDFYGYIGTDPRQFAVLNLSVEHSAGIDAPESEWTPRATLTVKPTSNVSVSVGPTYDWYWVPNQYDTTVAVKAADAGSARVYSGNRYFFSSLHQSTLSIDMRLNVTFTPSLSLQVYAQPLLGTGHYYDLKEFNRRRQLAMTGDPSRVDSAGNITVSPVGGATPYTLYNYDYNIRSLRGNAVLRWEYRRGSTVYFVWQQQRHDNNLYGQFADFSMNSGRADLFRAMPDNIFIVKFSYWIGR